MLDYATEQPFRLLGCRRRLRSRDRADYIDRSPGKTADERSRRVSTTDGVYTSEEKSGAARRYLQITKRLCCSEDAGVSATS